MAKSRIEKLELAAKEAIKKLAVAKRAVSIVQSRTRRKEEAAVKYAVGGYFLSSILKMPALDRSKKLESIAKSLPEGDRRLAFMSAAERLGAESNSKTAAAAQKAGVGAETQK